MRELYEEERQCVFYLSYINHPKNVEIQSLGPILIMKVFFKERLTDWVKGCREVLKKN